MTTCPICSKPVDPLRAPAVGVRDGKVVSYCSKEHAALAESGPTKLVPTKIVRVPSSAEHSVTPASGVPTRPDGPTDSAPVIAIVHERPPSDGDKAETAKVSTPRTKTDPSVTVARRDATPAPAPARKKRAESVQIADTGHLDDFVTPERRKGPLVAVGLLVAAGGVLAGAYALGVFGGSKEHVAATVESPSTGSAVVPSLPATPDAGAMAVSVAPVSPVATPVTATQAVARATEVLRAQMKSESPRVQRVAASALARTGDKDSIELLVTALGKETGELAKVELAYTVARAGDKRGLDALVAAAAPGKRESKHEAGARLAMLGDARATKFLEPSLQYPQFRLGVAETLARLAVPSALTVLDTVRADPKALPDEKARATIALGIAGRKEVIPELTAMLGDDRNNAFAAVALAGMQQEAARPVLEKQLTIPSLRVQAARALRRLAPDADVSRLLPPLVSALDSNKDTEQVQVAEALLLLAGPPAWSERE